MESESQSIEVTVEAARVPANAHLEQYFGPWAMAEQHFSALAERAKRLDLSAHLAATPTLDDVQTEAIEVRDGVAVIELAGTLMKHVSSLGGGTSTTIAKRQVRNADRQPGVHSILLNIDSPGGTVAGTKELADAVRKTDKPVIAFVSDLGASAAYWIASQADKVFTNATAMIGSIGTFGVVHDMSEAAAKDGIRVHVIRAGRFKGEGVPGTEVSAEYLAEEQRIVDELNEFFLAAVAKGRGMTKLAVRDIADGRVHVGEAAHVLGLTDGIRTYEQAFSLTKNTRSTQMAHEPASYEELVSACIGADAEFIGDQQRQKHTVEQARDDWMAEQALQLEERNAELTAALQREQRSKAVEAAAEKMASEGVDAAPVSSIEAGTGEHGESFVEWNEIVKANIGAGLSRHKAVKKAAKQHPQLRQQMVDEYNITHSHLKDARN